MPVTMKVSGSSMTANLGQLAARGAVWSIGGQVVHSIVNLVGLSILARLVSPEHFGLVAMITSIVGVGELFRDFGLTNATIQAPTISSGESNNLFWINTVIGALLGVAFFLSAGMIASFYRQPELVEITRVISVVFVLNGAATQPRAMLTRWLRTKALAGMDVASAFLGLGAGVLIALAGGGYWSLVGMQIVRAITIAIVAIVLARYKPLIPDRSVSIRHFVRFGMGLFGAQMLNYLSRNIDNVVIGRVLGAQALGVYSRAYQLGYLPMSQLSAPINRVAMPVLSRVASDPPRYNNYLSRIQKGIMLAISGGYALAIVFADLVIRVALGPGWDEAILVFQIICLAGIVESAHQISYFIFVSTARTGKHFQFAIISRPILIIGILLAVSYGIVAVALVVVFWIVLAWPFGLWIATRNTTISARAIMNIGLRNIASAGLIITAGLFAQHLVEGSADWLSYGSRLASILAVSSLIWLLSPMVRRDVKDTMSFIPLLRRSREVG